MATASKSTKKTNLKALPTCNMKWLPDTVKKLDNELKSAGLEGKSIHDGWDCESASKISKAQYLLLGVLIMKRHKAKDFQNRILGSYVKTEYLERARTRLDSSPEFQQYLDAIPLSRLELVKNNWNGLTTFREILDLQLTQRGDIYMLDPEEEKEYLSLTESQDDQSTQGQLAAQIGALTISSGTDNTPSGKQKGPASKSSSDEREPLRIKEDEQLVNFASCGYGKAIVNEDGELPVVSSPTRCILQFNLPDGKTKVFEARTDGFDRWSLRGDSSMLAIAETKRDGVNGTYSETTKVLMQMGAQMAAWISVQPLQRWEKMPNNDGKYMRSLMGQFSGQLFHMFAEIDEDYIQYIRNDRRGKGGKIPSMPIRMLGPYEIHVPRDMKMFAFIRNGYLHQLKEARRSYNEGLVAKSSSG
ncbi:hypothetical protein F5X96DRAFT_670698 [Biscogniauxia mediterranea]|nr:hypothetical protein F5X96DRAFT_670698 [Biscogniauxia mediterranea]